MALQTYMLLVFLLDAASLAFPFSIAKQSFSRHGCRSSSEISSSIHQSKSTVSMFLTRDEYLQPHFEAPPRSIDMNRIVYCAETNGECSMTEMVGMMEGTSMSDDAYFYVPCIAASYQLISSMVGLSIKELDRLNDSSNDNGAYDDEKPSFDPSMTAREALKSSLQSQVDWMTAKQDLDSQRQVLDQWKSEDKTTKKQDTLDHSFDHHVDYRAIAEYESH